MCLTDWKATVSSNVLHPDVNELTVSADLIEEVCTQVRSMKTQSCFIFFASATVNIISMQG